MTYQKTVFDNGLTLLAESVPAVRSVAMAVFVATGSRYESDAEAGMSHFVEHVLFKGSSRWPTAQAISEAIEGVGGLVNASTSRETTMYWVKVAQPHVRLALDVLTDMLQHPIMDPREVSKEQRVILEEIGMLHDSPESLVQILITDLLWPNQPLGREISGTRESVSAVTPDTLSEYMGRFYGPNRTFVSIAGAIDVDELSTMIGDYFGAWQPVPGDQPEPYNDSQDAPRVEVGFKETEQAHLCLAMPGLLRDHPDRFTLTLANTILGDGMSSRLFQEIRERQALAYSVDSFVSSLQDTGMMGVYAGVDPHRAEQALVAILNELSRIRNELVSSEELTRAVEFNKGRLLLQMENTSAIASWNGRQEALPGKVYSVDEVVEILEQITREDILRVMQEVLRPDKLNLAVVGPFKDRKPFADRLVLS